MYYFYVLYAILLDCIARTIRTQIQTIVTYRVACSVCLSIGRSVGHCLTSESCKNG